MFEGFETKDIDTAGARIHLRHGGKVGDGPPLLLLHGNPMTHVSWHLIAPKLAKDFHVVAADLRGYGDSTAPEPLEDYSNYSFRAMGQDMLEVMESLGHKEFFLAGHDRGARTAHRMALDHPDRIQKVALLDILPSHHVWANADAAWAKKSWHWVFQIQPAPFPEEMMSAVPAEWYMEKKLSKPGIGLDFMSKESFNEYVRCFTKKTIIGSCADYRACATIDFDLDDADFKAGNKIKPPTLAIWGAKSHTGKVWGDCLEIWQKYAESVTGGPIDCGHYVPEEKPADVYDSFIKFFSS